MTDYQRAMRAIEHEPGAPVVRGELVIDRRFARNLVCWRGGDSAADGLADTALLLSCSRLLKLDLVCIPAEEATGQETVLAPPAKDIGQFTDCDLFVFWLVDGAFQSAMAERGMMAVMTDLARSPDTVARELQHRSLQVSASIARGVEAGAHGILIADDIAYRQGPLMSPELVQRCILPVWRAQAKAAHDLGVPVFFHSDGNLNAVLPYIVAAGFDGLQCLEPAAGMNIGAVKAQYGETLCLMGNIDPALLHASDSSTGSADGTDKLCWAIGEVMAANNGRGGLIFGTCSGLHIGMQPDRVYHMYKLAAKLDPAGQTDMA